MAGAEKKLKELEALRDPEMAHPEQEPKELTPAGAAQPPKESRAFKAGLLAMLLISWAFFQAFCPGAMPWPMHDPEGLSERHHHGEPEIPPFDRPTPISPPPRELLDCDKFDASKIKLVTFDVFAALMDLSASLKQHVARAVPKLSQHEVDQLSEAMMTGYGNYMGHEFTKQETGGLQPFEWMARTTLSKAILDLGLSVRIPTTSREFNEVLGAWSDLIPRNGTAETLAKLAPHFMLAPLSNGDSDTLIEATRVFAPEVKMSFIFSSDYPVGVFKPLAPIYDQVGRVSGLEPEEILHVAGSAFDAKGARESGLFAALSWGEPEKEGAQPCFVLKELKELLFVLGVQ